MCALEILVYFFINIICIECCLKDPEDLQNLDKMLKPQPFTCTWGQCDFATFQASGKLEGDIEGVVWALETMVLARRQLLPAIQNGNQGCGGRLRSVSILCVIAR